MKENILIEDFDFTLIADFFKRIDRQGPGGDNEAMLAKYLLPNFEKDIRIADIGCGTGRQTAVLTDLFDGRIDRQLLRPHAKGYSRKAMPSSGRKASVESGLSEGVTARQMVFSVRDTSATTRLVSKGASPLATHSTEAYIDFRSMAIYVRCCSCIW